MPFVVTDRAGRSYADPSASQIDAVLAELALDGDNEHPDVSLAHESGWVLSAFGSGLLIWEHVDEGEPRHIAAATPADVRRLWDALAEGDIALVEREHWSDGYG